MMVSAVQSVEGDLVTFYKTDLLLYIVLFTLLHAQIANVGYSWPVGESDFAIRLSPSILFCRILTSEKSPCRQKRFSALGISSPGI